MIVWDARTVADDYTDATTVQPNLVGTSGGYLFVSGNPIYLQMAYQTRGQGAGGWQWAEEVPIAANSNIIFAPGTLGFRVRNYTAGKAASVSVALSGAQEPPLMISSGGVASNSIVTGGGLIVGEIKIWPGASNPDATKFLFCDGSAVSRSTYANLFTAIGTLYGAGDGVTTFNLPDLQGRVVAGLAAAGGHADVTTLGNTDGSALANRRPKHNQTMHAQGSSSPPAGQAVADPGWAGEVGGGGVQSGSFNAATQRFLASGPQTGAEPLDAPAYLVLAHYICFAS